MVAWVNDKVYQGYNSRTLPQLWDRVERNSHTFTDRFVRLELGFGETRNNISLLETFFVPIVPKHAD